MEPYGLPIAVTAGDNDDVWVVTEFGNALHQVTASTDSSSRRFQVPIKVRKKDWPFLRDQGLRTPNSISENIVRDSRGSIWFPQTANWVYYNKPGISQNYSRIVSYNPKHRKFCVFPVPDDNASVMGVTWDEDRKLVWFSQPGNEAIVSFNPAELRSCYTYNNYMWKFDSRGLLVRPLPINYCDGDRHRGCMRKYVLGGGKGLINQLVVQQAGDPDPGSVWFTEYFGNHIGRLDPRTGEVLRFPIHAFEKPVAGDWSTVFRRVHKILVHPISGDLVFTANSSGEIIKFDLQRFKLNPETCQQLDASGKNPCMDAIQVPVFSKTDAGQVTSHSISFDRYGNLWFSTWANKCPLVAQPPGVGFIHTDWQTITFLHDLKLPRQPNQLPEALADSGSNLGCGDNNWPLWAFKGIAVDDQNNVWFSNYFQRLIHRLRYKRADRAP